MKKAFDQTVRDLKREVNKKVLKVPGIEQKVLDATSNEPWGPHGSLLADIANASRNYHEFQLIMGVIWKRINDTGKNWRHVYKGLTVLEYLVANGSERVIDEIREHAYQISTLSDFQYIDSSGKDQGNNVRKKSQSLVQLVNDKERIAEVRQKAEANRDKFRSASSTGGMHRPNSYSGGYGDRFEDDRNSYGRDKESGYREDDRYARYGDSYNHNGDRDSRDSYERYDRDGYKDDDYRGRSRSVEGQKYSTRSRSYERDGNRAYENDGNYSSQGSGTRTDSQSQDGRRLDRKFSEQDLGAPPNYEEAVNGGRSPPEKEVPAVRHIASPPPTVTTPGQSPSNPSLNRSTSSSPVTHYTPAPSASHNVSVPSMSHNAPLQSVDPGFVSFDEFDPRGTGTVSAPAPPTYTDGTAGDFLADALALVPVSSSETYAATDSSFSASASGFDQHFEDPFGETPFRAVSQVSGNTVSTQSHQPSTSQSPDPAHSTPQHATTFSGQQNQDVDILAGILPLTEALQALPPATFQTTLPSADQGFDYQSEATAPNGQITQQNSGYFQHVPANLSSSHLAHQGSLDATMQYNTGLSHPSSTLGGPHMSMQSHIASNTQHHNGGFIQRTSSAPLQIEHNRESFLPQYSTTHFVPQSSGVPSAVVTSQPGQLGMAHQPAKDKFETKSTIWADTLSRGLVNLNISGSKTNPMADIGVDFDALNRKERRMEKPAAAAPISTVTMGKAMGSGSGMGRAGSSAIRPPPGPMVGSGMGFPSYGGMNQQVMGMNRAPGIGSIGQGSQVQQPIGGVYGSQQPTMGGGGGYGPQQPMMGGGYNSQQPYGRGYQ